MRETCKFSKYFKCSFFSKTLWQFLFGVNYSVILLVLNLVGRQKDSSDSDHPASWQTIIVAQPLCLFICKTNIECVLQALDTNDVFQEYMFWLRSPDHLVIGQGNYPLLGC